MNSAQGITDKQRTELAQAQARVAYWGTPELDYSDSGLWEFLSHVYTKDEHDRTAAKKKLPVFERPYMQVVFRAMLRSPLLAIPKSRQIMVSWMLAAFACWFARTGPNRKIIWQSKKQEDAESMVSMGDRAPTVGRIDFIEYHLPGWLRDPHIHGGAGNKVGHLIYHPRPMTLRQHIYVPWHGSQIRAVPMGSDQARSNTISLFIGDEAAFQEDFEATMTGLLPAITGGGRVILVSSVDPGYFVDLVLEGTDLQEVA